MSRVSAFVSQQIIKLEAELGEKLLDRQRGRTVPTTAGQLLRERAERILREVKEAQQEVHDMTGALRGKVEFGALPTIAPYLLPRIIEEFSGLHPGVEMVVHEDTTARLTQGLEQNELDLALTSLPLASPRLEAATLFSDELLLALPLKHPLVRKKSIRLDELAKQNFILMKEGHCLGTQSLQFCQTRGFSPRVVCRSGQIETIQALVRCGVGISLVPQMACSPGTKDLVYRSISATSSDTGNCPCME